MNELGVSELNEHERRMFLEGSDSGVPACPFCLELADPSYALNFLGIAWPFSDRVLFSDGLVVAIPGYGPQVNPYALVIPRRHIESMAETSREERAAVLNCLDTLLSIGMFSSGTMSLFEHGDCGGRQHHSCLEHCHLHVVDGSIPITEWLRDEHREIEEATISADVLWTPKRAYLWAGTYSGAGYASGLLDMTGSHRSQFFRRLIAARLGQRKWNWREGMNWDYMRELVAYAKARI